jgi:hypothetical protein
MIVEVLVAESQAIQALTEQTRQVMRTAGASSGIVQRFGHRLAQTESAIRLLQQQHTAITGDVAAVESGFNPTAFAGWKVKRLLGTFCHGQSLVRIQLKQLNLIELHGLCPFYW